MIDPRGTVDVKQWADFITLPLMSALGIVARRLDNAQDWPVWAFDLMQDQKLQSTIVADPRGFSDWRDWAERFNQVVPY